MNGNKDVLRWINSGGGPFLLLEQRLLPHWSGVHDSKRPSDYERACGIDGYLGLITIGPGVGLVLDDEPLQTSFLTLEEGFGLLLIRWEYANDNESVFESLSSLTPEVWKGTGLSLEVPQGQLVLFDAACAIEDQCPHLEITIATGQYSIATAQFRPNKDTSLILHRLLQSATVASSDTKPM